MGLKHRIKDVLDGGHSATIHKDEQHIVTIKNVNGIVVLEVKKTDIFKQRIPVKLLKTVTFILKEHRTVTLKKDTEGFVFARKAWFNIANNELIGIPFKNVSFATDIYF